MFRKSDADVWRHRWYAPIFEATFLAGVTVNSIITTSLPTDPTCKSTQWHLFLLHVFAYNLRLSQSYLPTAVWESIEIWLKYDADPRVAFWKLCGTSKPIIGELGISEDDIIVVSEDKITLMNISMAENNGRKLLSLNAFRTSGTWIQRILQEQLNSVEGKFSLSDLVRAENPPNIEELLRLIDRNTRTREAQTRDSITELSPSEDQLEGNQDSALELASKLQAQTHENPEPSGEVTLKPDVKTPITPATKANTLLDNATATSSLRTWILFSALLVAGSTYFLADYFSKSWPLQAQGEACK